MDVSGDSITVSRVFSQHDKYLKPKYFVKPSQKLLDEIYAPHETGCSCPVCGATRPDNSPSNHINNARSMNFIRPTEADSRKMQVDNEYEFEENLDERGMQPEVYNPAGRLIVSSHLAAVQSEQPEHLFRSPLPEVGVLRSTGHYDRVVEDEADDDEEEPTPSTSATSVAEPADQETLLQKAYDETLSKFRNVNASLDSMAQAINSDRLPASSASSLSGSDTSKSGTSEALAMLLSQFQQVEKDGSPFSLAIVQITDFLNRLKILNLSTHIASLFFGNTSERLVSIGAICELYGFLWVTSAEYMMLYNNIISPSLDILRANLFNSNGDLKTATEISASEVSSVTLEGVDIIDQERFQGALSVMSKLGLDAEGLKGMPTLLGFLGASTMCLATLAINGWDTTAKPTTNIVALGNIARAFNNLEMTFGKTLQYCTDLFMRVCGLSVVPEHPPHIRKFISEISAEYQYVVSILDKIDEYPYILMEDPTLIQQVEQRIASFHVKIVSISGDAKSLPNLRYIMDLYKKYVEELTNLMRDLRMCCGKKLEPVVLHIAGETNIGKTECVAEIVRRLGLLHGRALTVFTRNIKDEFVSGYHNQDVFVYDDYLNDAEGKDVQEQHRLCGDAPVPLNQAAIENKGMPFTSSYIINCSNFPYIKNSPLIRDVESVNRRRHHVYYVRNVGVERWKKENVGNYPDETSGVFYPDFRHLDFYRLPQSESPDSPPFSKGDAKITGPYPYYRLQDVVNDLYKLHLIKRDRFSQYLQTLSKDRAAPIPVQPTCVQCGETNAKNCGKCAIWWCPEHPCRHEIMRIACEVITQPVQACQNQPSPPPPRVIVRNAIKKESDEVEAETEQTVFTCGLTIALLGEAGTGKTTLMKMLTTRCKTEGLSYHYYLTVPTKLEIGARFIFFEDVTRSAVEFYRFMDFVMLHEDGFLADTVFVFTGNDEPFAKYLRQKDRQLVEAFDRRIWPYKFSFKTKKSFVGMNLQNYCADDVRGLHEKGNYNSMVHILEEKGHRQVYSAESLINHVILNALPILNDIEATISLPIVPQDACVYNITYNDTVSDFFSLIGSVSGVRKVVTIIIPMLLKKASVPFHLTGQLTRIVGAITSCGVDVIFKSKNSGNLTVEGAEQAMININNMHLPYDSENVIGIEFSDYGIAILSIEHNGVPCMILARSTLGLEKKNAIPNDESQVLLKALYERAFKYLSTTENERKAKIVEMVYDRLGSPWREIIQILQLGIPTIAAGFGVYTIFSNKIQIRGMRTEIRERADKCLADRQALAGMAGAKRLSQLGSEYPDIQLLATTHPEILHAVEQVQKHGFSNSGSDTTSPKNQPVWDKTPRHLKHGTKLKASKNHSQIMPVADGKDLTFSNSNPIPTAVLQQVDRVQHKYPVQFDHQVLREVLEEARVLKESGMNDVPGMWTKMMTRDSINGEERHSSVDNAALDLRRKIARSMGKLEVEGKHVVFCLGVVENIVVTTLHAWIETRALDYFAEFYREPGRRFKLEFLASIPSEDVVYLRVLGNCSHFPDLRKHMQHSDSYAVPNNVNGCVVIPERVMRKDAMFYVAPCIVREEMTLSGGDKALLYSGYLKQIALRSLVETGPGDCGSPIILCNPDFNNKLVAIHKGAVRGQGLAVRVFCNDLDEFVKPIKQEAALPYQEITLFPTEFSLPNGKSIIGCLNAPLHQNAKTSMCRSPLETDKFGDNYLPTILSHKDPRLPEGSDFDPYETKFHWLHYGRPHTEFEITTDGFETCDKREKVLYICAKRVARFWIDAIKRSGLTLEKLTLTEAINRKSCYTFMNVMNRSTSPSWPWVRSCKRGKKEFLNFEQDGLWRLKTDGKGAEMLSALSVLENAMAQDQRVPFVFTETLKDEVRPKEKVLITPKTRTFAACPMEVTLLGRRYLGAFFAMVAACWPELHHCLGVDPDSEDWDIMCRSVIKTHSEFGNGDYKEYDSTHQRVVKKAYRKMIIKAYELLDPKNTERDSQVRKRFLKSLDDAVVADRELLYRFQDGIFSGRLDTTFFNIFANQCYAYYTWYARMSELKMITELPLAKFHSEVGQNYMGDDNFFSYKDIEKFNFQDQVRILKEHLDIILTDAASKDESVVFRSRKLHEIDYLKREIFFFGGRFVGALKLESLDKMTNWLHGKKHPGHTIEYEYDAAILTAVCHSILRAIVVRGKTIYEEMREHLTQKLTEYSIPYEDYMTWEEQLQSMRLSLTEENQHECEVLAPSLSKFEYTKDGEYSYRTYTNGGCRAPGTPPKYVQCPRSSGSNEGLSVGYIGWRLFPVHEGEVRECSIAGMEYRRPARQDPMEITSSSGCDTVGTTYIDRVQRLDGFVRFQSEDMRNLCTCRSTCNGVSTTQYVTGFTVRERLHQPSLCYHRCEDGRRIYKWNDGSKAHKLPLHATNAATYARRADDGRRLFQKLRIRRNNHSSRACEIEHRDRSNAANYDHSPREIGTRFLFPTAETSVETNITPLSVQLSAISVKALWPSRFNGEVSSNESENKAVNHQSNTWSSSGWSSEMGRNEFDEVLRRKSEIENNTMFPRRSESASIMLHNYATLGFLPKVIRIVQRHRVRNNDKRLCGRRTANRFKRRSPRKIRSSRNMGNRRQDGQRILFNKLCTRHKDSCGGVHICIYRQSYFRTLQHSNHGNGHRIRERSDDWITTRTMCVDGVERFNVRNNDSVGEMVARGFHDNNSKSVRNKSVDSGSGISFPRMVGTNITNTNSPRSVDRKDGTYDVLLERARRNRSILGRHLREQQGRSSNNVEPSNIRVLRATVTRRTSSKRLVRENDGRYVTRRQDSDQTPFLMAAAAAAVAGIAAGGNITTKLLDFGLQKQGGDVQGKLLDQTILGNKDLIAAQTSGNLQLQNNAYALQNNFVDRAVGEYAKSGLPGWMAYSGQSINPGASGLVGSQYGYNVSMPTLAGNYLGRSAPQSPITAGLIGTDMTRGMTMSTARVGLGAPGSQGNYPIARDYGTPLYNYGPAANNFVQGPTIPGTIGGTASATSIPLAEASPVTA